MKKTIAALLLLMILISGVWAYQNTFTSESPEWKFLIGLYRLQGKTIHGVITPVSAQGMLFLLNELDIEEFPEQVRLQALKLKNELENPSTMFDMRNLKAELRPYASLAGVGNTSKEIEFAKLPLEYRNIEPLLEVQALLMPSDFIAGFIRLDLVKAANQYESGKLDTNFETDLAGSSMDFYRPHRAYVSLGGHNLNLIIGRDRLSAGLGYSGNLLIGDNFFFQDFIKASYLGPFLSYDLSITAFDSNNGTLADAETSLKPSTWDEMHPEVLNHRISFNFFNKVTLTLTEGVMNYTDNALGNAKMLNPFNILHNQFTFRNHRINNFFAIELDWAIAPRWAFHSQFIGDQIQLPFESGDLTPNSYGLLANLSFAIPIKSGISTFYIEGVYTSPSLYLKDTKTIDGEVYDHEHIDLIFGNKLTGRYDISYMGYINGPDAIVAETGFRISSLNGFCAAASFMYMAHGENRIHSDNSVSEAPVMGEDEPKFIFTPTKTDGVTDVEHTFVIKATAEMLIGDSVTVEAGAALQRVLNYMNEIGKDIWDASFQLTIRIDAMSLFGL